MFSPFVLKSKIPKCNLKLFNHGAKAYKTKVQHFQSVEVRVLPPEEASSACVRHSQIPSPAPSSAIPSPGPHLFWQASVHRGIDVHDGVQVPLKEKHFPLKKPHINLKETSKCTAELDQGAAAFESTTVNPLSTTRCNAYENASGAPQEVHFSCSADEAKTRTHANTQRNGDNTGTRRGGGL